ASVAPECNQLKAQYDACFNRWYGEKFLKGDTTDDCGHLFKQYKACVWKTIREKNIDKLINDARKENTF
ncbi:mitochondrial distribution/morphology family 35/apoptosis, partial [Zopfochytrium polystomum]